MSGVDLVLDFAEPAHARCRSCANQLYVYVTPVDDRDHIECDGCGAREVAVTHWVTEDGELVPRLELVR